VLIKRAEPISTGVERGMPPALERALEGYHDWLSRLEDARSRSATWKLAAPSAGRALLLLLIIAGCVALATPAHNLAADYFGPDLLFPSGTTVLAVLATGVVVLAPLLAAWRNLSVVARVVAQSGGQQRAGAVQAMLERGFTIALCLLATLWLMAVVPAEVLATPLMASVVLLLGIVMVLLARSLTRWHDQIETRVMGELGGAGSDDAAPQWSLLAAASAGPDGVLIQEVHIPGDSMHAGSRLADLALRTDWHCSVLGIDRQGYAINNPQGSERLFPGDRLLVLARADHFPRAEAFLRRGVESPDWAAHFDELGTEHVTVPPGAPAAGLTLRELDLTNRFGIQVGAITRDGVEIISPGAGDALQVGDRVLILGTMANIRRFLDASSQSRLSREAVSKLE
jgi:CPA2 family monovalent cation:H+ antiporter-2